MDGVKVELNEGDLLQMTDSEKLIYLIKIALMNRTDLNTQNKILFGNGDPKKGLCSQILSLGLHIKGIWATIGVGGGIILAILVRHVIGG
jgi:hypothetical protein